ncbi:2-iminobutanoate/2-iminopropanoate deaminase rida [Holotrichia oblita]|nr:2-iminobutanoate/2-iminopropanoate deaminase rida [Holotrichia oblita]
MKKIISTEKAPAAIGPYSQGVKISNLVYTSGQLPINMANGELELNDIKAAAKYCLQNISAILEAAGTSMDNVIKATVFLTDLGDFNAVNEVYGEFFKENPPSRSCIQVAALPKGVHVEIEAIACCE